jgi:hypothetical protein
VLAQLKQNAFPRRARTSRRGVNAARPQPPCVCVCAYTAHSPTHPRTHPCALSMRVCVLPIDKRTMTSNIAAHPPHRCIKVDTTRCRRHRCQLVHTCTQSSPPAATAALIIYRARARCYFAQAAGRVRALRGCSRQLTSGHTQCVRARREHTTTSNYILCVCVRALFVHTHAEHALARVAWPVRWIICVGEIDGARDEREREKKCVR